MEVPEGTPRRGARETLKLVLVQLLVLIVIATAALSGPTESGVPLYRVLGCGFVLCVILLALLMARTDWVAWTAAGVFCLFAVLVGLGRGWLDVAVTAVGATALGLGLRRWLPAH